MSLHPYFRQSTLLYNRYHRATPLDVTFLYHTLTIHCFVHVLILLSRMLLLAVICTKRHTGTRQEEVANSSPMARYMLKPLMSTRL